MGRTQLTGMASLVLTLIALMPTARAGNRHSFFLGNDAAMTAGAVGATTRDSEAVYYNPAGLGGVSRDKLDLSGTVFMYRLQRIPKGMRSLLNGDEFAQDLSGDEFLVVPTALSFVRNLTEQVSLGFGVFVPQYRDIFLSSSLSEAGETVELDIMEAVYNQAYELSVTEMHYDFAVAVGWQPLAGLRFGMGLYVSYGDSRLTNKTMIQAYSAEDPAELSIFQTESLLAHVRWVGLRATAGLQWAPLPQLHLGFVVVIPTWGIRRWGNVSQTISGAGLDEQGQPAVPELDHVYVEVSEWGWEMIYPVGFQLSVAFRQPHYWIALDLEIYLPMDNDQYDIHRTVLWNVRAGSKFRISKSFSVGVGLFTDNTDRGPINSLGDSRVSYYGATIGTEFRTPLALRKDPDPEALVFSTTLAFRYALGHGRIGGWAIDPSPQAGIVSLVTRNYVHFHEFSIHLGSALLF